MKALITGGARFIVFAVDRRSISNTSHYVIDADKLTYASNLDSLKSAAVNLRYAIDAKKVHAELGWMPLETFEPSVETFESGNKKTVEWYTRYLGWCNHVLDGSCQCGRLGSIS